MAPRVILILLAVTLAVLPVSAGAESDTDVNQPLLLDPVPTPRATSAPRTLDPIMPTLRSEDAMRPEVTPGGEPTPSLRGEVQPPQLEPVLRTYAARDTASIPPRSSDTGAPHTSTPVVDTRATTGLAGPAATPDRAAPVAERISPVDASRIRALFNALRFYDRADYARAESLAIEIIRSYPGDTAALTLAGAARLKQGNTAGAIEVFTAWIERNPLEGIAHFYMGLAYHQAGDRERAIDSYWTAVLLDPSLEAARANLEQLRKL